MSEILLAGCPFCDWTQEVEVERNDFFGRGKALMAGTDHALAEHMDKIGGRS